MPSSILDSAFPKDLYGTAQMRAVFDDPALLQKWLDVEVALARSRSRDWRDSSLGRGGDPPRRARRRTSTRRA